MTREELNLAKDLEHDIDMLKEIQKTMKENHWIAFTTAEKYVKEENFHSDFLIDAFEQFVNEKLLVATKKLEDL